MKRLYEYGKVDPEKIAFGFLDSFKKRKIRGIGSSTLKAMRDLEVGNHWYLSGMGGEYSAGNGAAMRISPLAYFVDLDFDRTVIRDVTSITHKNEEAYCGALAILYAIRYAFSLNLKSDGFIETLINCIFDSRLRDRLIEIHSNKSLDLLGIAEKYGSGGYVVESVPLSLFAAKYYLDGIMTFSEVLQTLIKCGEDTDTICSMSGNIIGASKREEKHSDEEDSLIEQLKILPEYERVESLLNQVE